MAMEHLPVQNFEKENGRYSHCLKNYKSALNVIIFQLTSSNLHKRYMARKASLIVIWPDSKNKIATISHVLCQMGLSS